MQRTNHLWRRLCVAVVLSTGLAACGTASVPLGAPAAPTRLTDAPGLADLCAARAASQAVADGNDSERGGDTAADFALDGDAEAQFLAHVDDDLAALNALQVVRADRVSACDEAACIYFCDTDPFCVDTPIAAQAERLAALRAMADDVKADIDAGRITANDAPRAEGDAPFLLVADQPAQVTADLAALDALHIVMVNGFAELSQEECGGCYTDTIDSGNRLRAAGLHALTQRAMAAFGTCPDGA